MKKVTVVCLVLLSVVSAMAQDAFVLKDTGTIDNKKQLRVYLKATKPAAADEKPVVVLEDQGITTSAQLTQEKASVLSQIKYHQDMIIALQDRGSLLDAIIAKAATMEVAPK